MFDLYYKGRDSHLLHWFGLFSTHKLQNNLLVTIKFFFKQRKEISIYINKLIINTWKSKTAQKFVSSSTVGFPSWLAWRIISWFSFQQTADEKYPWDMNYNTKKRNYTIVLVQIKHRDTFDQVISYHWNFNRIISIRSCMSDGDGF